MKNSNYDFTCPKCSHEADFFECEKSGGYFNPPYLQCPMCGNTELTDNESLNEKLYL